jgi:superfamily II DNA or RNA helicase
LAGASKRLALRYLRELGKEPYPFQADTAVSCLDAIRDRERLLVEAPTGTGKTLIAHLTVALLTHDVRDRYPRVLVIVPTRALLAQHSFDAGWLRRFGLAIHMLTPDTPPLLFAHVLEAYGVLLTTPVTLSNRLSVTGAEALAGFDCAIFDEIDTYLTIEELKERQDIGPALQLCLEAGLPTIGFTGTHLTQAQLDAWRASGFSERQVAIPRDWMPLTPVRFEGVTDSRVIRLDEGIRERIKTAYSRLKEELGITGDIPWSDVRRLARSGNQTAASLLLAMTERLQLFESGGSTDAKYRGIVEISRQPGPTLILTRYRDVAALLAAKLLDSAVTAVHLHGGMNRMEIERKSSDFRERDGRDVAALVITRELGGRGLDFPSAARVVLISPRSNYQAVAQELARIRSRFANQKEALVFYYERTEEAAKGRRLGVNLRRDKYGDDSLFTVTGLPPVFELDPFESRNLRNEESLAPDRPF